MFLIISIVKINSLHNKNQNEAECISVEERFPSKLSNYTMNSALLKKIHYKELDFLFN